MFASILSNTTLLHTVITITRLPRRLIEPQSGPGLLVVPTPTGVAAVRGHLAYCVFMCIRRHVCVHICVLIQIQTQTNKLNGRSDRSNPSVSIITDRRARSAPGSACRSRRAPLHVLTAARGMLCRTALYVCRHGMWMSANGASHVPMRGLNIPRKGGVFISFLLLITKSALAGP